MARAGIRDERIVRRGKIMMHRTGQTSVNEALSKLHIVDLSTIRQRFDEAPEAAHQPAQPTHSLVTAVALAIERLLAIHAERELDFPATADAAAAAGTVSDLADILGRTLAQLEAIRWCQCWRADWEIHASAAASPVSRRPADQPST